MNFHIKLNIVTCIIACLLACSVKAQKPASDKPFNQIYNKRINEKLVQMNNTKQSYKPLQQKQNLPSNQSSLKDIVNLKMKNTGIYSHYNSNLTTGERNSKLPSNSPKLKELGKPAIKSQTRLIK